MYTQLKQEMKVRKKVKTYQSTGEKTTALRGALEWAIKEQMLDVPYRFHKIVRKDKRYPAQFAEHMIQKLGEGRILVINDTVAMALRKLQVNDDVNSLYRYLDIKQPVAVKKKAKKLSPKKKAARLAELALKKFREPDPDVNFRGC